MLLRVRRNPFLALFFVFLLIGSAVYLPALRAYFVSDDFSLIGKVARRAETGSCGPDDRFLRPLIALSYLMDFAVWGFRAAGYHFRNIVLHVANAVLVSVLADLLLTASPHLSRPKVRVIAALAGLVFLVLPCHSEPVAWISGRTDVIATLFMLLALIGYASGTLSASRPILLASWLSFFLALLAKESAICFPFVVLILALHLHWGGRASESFKRTVKGVLPYVVLLALYFGIRYLALGTVLGGYGRQGHLRFGASLILDCLARYTIRSALPPLPSGIVRLLYPEGRLLWFAIVVGTPALLWVLCAWRAGRDQARLVLTLTGCFWAALLPVINVRIQLATTPGERFVYFASVFTAITIAYCIVVCIASLRVTGTLVLVFALVSASSLYTLNRRWEVAGSIARQVAQGIAAAATHENVLLVNRPDSYRGAYVLRNGLDEAVRTFAQARHVKAVHAAFVQVVDELDDEVRLTRNDTVPGTFTLELSNKSTECGLFDGTFVVLKESAANTFTFQLDLHPSSMDIFYYTSGRVAKVP